MTTVRGLIETLCDAAVAYGEDGSDENDLAYYNAKAALISAVQAMEHLVTTTMHEPGFLDGYTLGCGMDNDRMPSAPKETT